MRKKRRKILIFARIFVMAILLGVCVFWVHLQKQSRIASTRESQRMAASTSSFAAACIGQILLTVQNNLNILAKQPMLRTFEKRPLLGKKMESALSYFLDISDACRLEIGLAYHRYLGFVNNLVYFSELPRAALRRIFFELSLQRFFKLEEQSYADDDVIFSRNSLNREDVERIHQQTRFARYVILAVQGWLEEAFAPLIKYAKAIDEYADFGHTTLKISNDAEAFLSAAISSKNMFKGLEVCNKYGVSQINYDRTGINHRVSSYEICKTLEGGRSVWVGKTYFEPTLNRFFWQVAYPIRDRNRNLVGCVRAAIETGDIDEWLKSFAEVSDVEVLVLDSDFTVISSSRPSRKKNHISFIKQIFEAGSIKIKSAQVTHVKSPVDGTEIFIKPVSQFRSAGLPGWKVAVLLKESSNRSFSENIDTFALILLAAAGLFALSYSAIQLNNLQEEEAVDDR
jgi:hypothetical protein